ncbi:ras association domain-containing protein 8-like isoform X2 [Antennarius striatus]|uniref:ras association domain-containing protein 8-like isoform X2 n=1 Tax=Antennarius striatus TaxID=241820 RepID=UPI0035B17A21
MELRVWVEGVVRVVCGLSLDTPCQDVVIALAQAIGRTGRYVLIARLRGAERALVADDCPLQYVAQMGQLGTEVQFVLRRTGPSLDFSSGTPTTERRLQLQQPSEPPPLKHGELRKALTFNLGPSASPRKTRPPTDWSPSPTASPEPQVSPALSWDSLPPVKSGRYSPAKENVFRRVLLQQTRLQDLELQLEALEWETEVWELKFSDPVPSPVSEGELEELEQQLIQNQTELLKRQTWEEQLQTEVDRERDMLRHLDQIRSRVEDHDRQIQELQDQSARLEEDLQPRVHRRNSEASSLQPDQVLRPLKQELQHRRQQGAQLEAELSETEEELQAAEETVQNFVDFV